METMRAWQDDEYIQEAGCDYFQSISKIDGVKTKLHDKKICSLLGNVIDNFKGRDQNASRSAKRSLEIYMI